MRLLDALLALTAVVSIYATVMIASLTRSDTKGEGDG
jgi:hypothetical protein